MAETQLLPVYLVIGADELKRETAVSRLKKRLDASGMADFNYDERDMSKEQEPEDVLSSLNTFPMGAPFRLVVLRGCDRLPKPLSEMLVEYLSAPSASTVCLIIATSLAKSTRLYKAAVKAAPKALIDCTPKKAWELPRQVRSMATAHGKAITQRAAEELVSRLGESTRLLDNDLRRRGARRENRRGKAMGYPERGLCTGPSPRAVPRIAFPLQERHDALLASLHAPQGAHLREGP